MTTTTTATTAGARTGAGRRVCCSKRRTCRIRTRKSCSRGEDELQRWFLRICGTTTVPQKGGEERAPGGGGGAAVWIFFFFSNQYKNEAFFGHLSFYHNRPPFLFFPFLHDYQVRALYIDLYGIFGRSFMVYLPCEKSWLAKFSA